MNDDQFLQLEKLVKNENIADCVANISTGIAMDTRLCIEESALLPLYAIYGCMSSLPPTLRSRNFSGIQRGSRQVTREVSGQFLERFGTRISGLILIMVLDTGAPAARNSERYGMGVWLIALHLGVSKCYL